MGFCGTKVKIYKVVLIFQWRNARCTCNRTCLLCTTVPLVCTCDAHNGCTAVPVLQVEQCFSYVLAIHTEELQLSRTDGAAFEPLHCFFSLFGGYKK